MRILLTRPIENAPPTIARLESLGYLGHDVCHSPLIEIRPTDEPLPSANYDGILLTSSNALPALSLHWANLKIPVLAVGSATGDAARSLGFLDVTHSDGGAPELIDLASNRFADSSPAHFLYPSATRPSHDVCAALTSRGFNCTPWRVYDTIEAESFTPTARELLEAGAIDCVLLYSARTAICFGSLFTALNPNSPPKIPRLLCISSNVASCLPSGLQAHCEISSHPDEDSLTNMI